MMRTRSHICLSLAILTLSLVKAMAQDIACLGQVVPGERVIRLSAPANSIIGEWLVQRGSTVNPGDPLAVLREAPIYQAQLDRMKAQVSLAKAELKQARAGERPELVSAQQALIEAHQAELRMLESRSSRYATLIEKNYIDQDRYDDLQSQIESLRARIHREESVLQSLSSSREEVVEKAEIAVQVAHAQVAEAQATLDLQTIRAPCSGEILDIHLWPGEGVLEGGAIASLGDTAHMRVLAEVDESDIARVKIGQRATLRGQAFPGEVAGEVVEILKLLDTSRVFPLSPSAYVDRRIVTVCIRPDDPALLSPFSHAQVMVTIQEK